MLAIQSPGASLFFTRNSRVLLFSGSRFTVSPWLRIQLSGGINLFIQKSMPTFSVRSVLRWSPRAEQKKKYIYEERITLWNAQSFTAAIDLAEREADDYAQDNAKRLGLLQGYWLFEECRLRKQGMEVFSLLRESDLPPKAYLKAFFDTGYEREGDYDTKDAPINQTPPSKKKLRPRRKAARR
jgi:hypothetical protein